MDMSDEFIRKAVENACKRVEEKIEKIFSKSTEELIQDYINYVDEMDKYCIKYKLDKFPSVRWDKYYKNFNKIWNEFDLIQNALKNRDFNDTDKLGKSLVKLYNRIPDYLQKDFLFGDFLK